MATKPARVYEGDDIPRIWVDIRIRRTMGALPPVALKCWLALKSILFLGCFAGTLTAAVWYETDWPQTVRIILAVIVLWQFWEQVVARRSFGTSHVLVTSKGVLFTLENVYLRWEEIESYQMSADLLRLKPAPGFGPSGMFSPKLLDIPLSEANRETLSDLFRENVKRWRPE